MFPVLTLLCLTFIGCAASQRPVLYPNNHLRVVGNAQAERDIDDCMQMAEAHVRRNQDSKVAEGAVRGGAIGAATGAAVGAVTGNFGRGLAAGAAGGAAGGATHGLFKAAEPSPVFKNFVNRCLREKGYEPIGWQ
ncbi:MAG: cell envelope biogenesis protein OmpA [Syntrophaceae bacterium]|nr:cell envelope biogenesis protein OmpA [Syntrophaceae bacterium]